MKSELKKRLENQMRIHWSWLKAANYKEAFEFIIAIIEKNEKNET